MRRAKSWTFPRPPDNFALPMPHEFKITRRIEFAETDLAGIVHFSNFFRMMEATEHAFFRSLGFSIHSHEDSLEPGRAIGWPRVSASCDYFRPLRFEDEVEIHLIVAEVRSRSIRYEFAFRRVGEAAEVARGTMAAVCTSVDQASGRLVAVPIPQRIRDQITAAPPELLKASALSAAASKVA
jgi:YbgC/YbaW family acyl-CoA thioester hydrolase